MHLCAVLAALCVCVCVSVCVYCRCQHSVCGKKFLHCQIDLPSLAYAGFRFTKEGITASQTSSVKWITDGTHTLPAPLTSPRQYWPWSSLRSWTFTLTCNQPLRQPYSPVECCPRGVWDECWDYFIIICTFSSQLIIDLRRISWKLVNAQVIFYPKLKWKIFLYNICLICANSPDLNPTEYLCWHSKSDPWRPQTLKDLLLMSCCQTPQDSFRSPCLHTSELFWQHMILDIKKLSVMHKAIQKKLTVGVNKK